MKKILVLDDVRENLIAIKDTLEDLIPDCLVLTGQSGKEGLKIARTEQPDTILTDIEMPGMNGFEVCKKFKENETTKHIPVMIFTGSMTDSETRIKCLEAGAEVFLSKPIDASELTAQINVLLRIKEAEDNLREERKQLDDEVKKRTKELQIANQKLQHDITERARTEKLLQESEEKFRILSETSPSAVMMYQNNKWIYVNEAATIISGYSRDELIGMDFWYFVHPDFKEKVKSVGKQRQKNVDTVSNYEFKITTKSGEEKWVWLNGSTTTYEGKTAGIVSVQDITNRKKKDEALKESEYRFKFLSKTTFEGIVVHKRGIIFDANDAFLRMTGYSRD